MTDPKFKAQHNSAVELETIAIVKTALEMHPPLAGYIFSQDIVVDEYVQPPHSHPIITLNTRDNHQPELVLSNFIHEQLHHYLDHNTPSLKAAVQELRKLYADVPVGFPDGARDQNSTYEHLILCTLEQRILRSVFGSEYARFSLTYWQDHHYRWIYKTVEVDYEKLLSIAQKFDLMPG